LSAIGGVRRAKPLREHRRGRKKERKKKREEERKRERKKKRKRERKREEKREREKREREKGERRTCSEDVRNAMLSGRVDSSINWKLTDDALAHTVLQSAGAPT
jgi:hypothetical protein